MFENSFRGERERLAQQDARARIRSSSSAFACECAEPPTESRKLCTAARRCLGSRGETPSLLFFCRRFLFQTKRKCRNAGGLYHLIIARSEGREWTLQFYLCRSRGSGASGSPHPTKYAAIRLSKFRGRMASAPAAYIYYFEQSKITPQSRLTPSRLTYRGA